MSQLDALTAAVIAAPEDAAPRRTYADAVRASDPERAQLIDQQLALRELRRRGEKPGAEKTQPPIDLVKKYGARWAPRLYQLARYVGFWGGFPEELELDAKTLLEHADEIAQLAPVRHLRVRRLQGLVSKVAALPLLGQLASLDLASNRLTDADVAALVGSPQLRGLRMLALTDNPIGLDAHRAIARAALPSLRFVEASQTGAPLVVRDTDWDGRVLDVGFTRAHDLLVRELGHLPWLDALDVPSLDTL